MMKWVIASQNIFLGKKGLYGCHMKLTLTWKLLKANMSFRVLACFAKWLAAVAMLGEQ